jgi:monoterpene epsilon-lactone hydrolase
MIGGVAADAADLMASSEAERVRAALFAARNTPWPSLAEFRRLMLQEAEKSALPEGVTITVGDLQGISAEWIVNAGGSGAGQILYLHGGAHVAGGCATHRNLASRLAIACRARVLVPEYRLAPEHRFPAQIEDATIAYDAMLLAGRRPRDVIVAGDSSGGGLAIALALSLRASGRPMPGALVLLSPWTDLTLSGSSYQNRRDFDPVDRIPALRRFAKDYAPEGMLNHPLVSPLFADLCGLPPMFIQVGDHETTLSDSTEIAARGQRCGVPVTLRIWPEMWHGWQLGAPALPEANEAIEQIASFVTGHFSALHR